MYVRENIKGPAFYPSPFAAAPLLPPSFALVSLRFDRGTASTVIHYHHRPTYISLSPTCVYLYLTHVTRTCFPCENPFIFPRFPPPPPLSLSSAAPPIPHGGINSHSRHSRFPPRSSSSVTTYLHEDISSYTRLVNRIREKQPRLARSTPLDRSVLPSRVHLAFLARYGNRNSLKRGLVASTTGVQINRHSCCYANRR